ncbi:MAG: DUF427 domain-containing protein [Pseudomonadota bacterium]
MTTLAPENVEDYPRPPALLPVSQTLRIVHGGEVVAETNRGFRVLETYHAPTYYLPRDDVSARLTPAHGRSFCEWKGVAAYWDVAAGDITAPHAAWSYPDPTQPFLPIKGYLAFYATLMEHCFVGDHRVIPQPGDFYGGWVTDNLRGPIKGAPGTEYW